MKLKTNITFCLNALCTRTSEGNVYQILPLDPLKQHLKQEIKVYVGMCQSLFFMPQTKEKFLIVSVGMDDTAVVPKLVILCVCECGVKFCADVLHKSPWVHEPRSPVCICMQKDHIRMLKIQCCPCQFGGLWQHQNNPAYTKGAKSLQNVEVVQYKEEK